MPSPSLPPVRKHGSFRGRIGIARADITPPVGIYARNWGAARHDVADSIHCPSTLSVLALAGDASTSPLVLVDGDLGWWRPLNRFDRFRERLLAETSLDASQLIVALSHTHASAPLMDPDPSLPGSELLEPWHESIYQASVACIREALSNPFEGMLDWHAGRCGLAANRDLPDPDPGKDRILCGFNPKGEPDDTLLLGRISDASGTVRGTLVNYACHPTVLAWENTSLSPDYIGALRSTMEAATGGTAFFLQGMSGDLAPRYQYVGDPGVADRHGRHLAHAALATLHDMEPPGAELHYSETVESGAPLAVWRHRLRELPVDLRSEPNVVELEIKDWPSASELERQRAECGDRALEERLRRKRDIRRALGDGRTYPLEICAWRMGDAVLVGSPCEPYSLLQQELRRRFADRPVVCMNLVNGSIGYLPPADRYDVDVYPVWQTPFARGSLERVQEAMTAAVERLLA